MLEEISIANKNVLVIFGSAVTDSINCRDINVFYFEDWSPEKEEVVRRWANGRGINHNVPINPQHSVWAWYDRIVIPGLPDGHPEPVYEILGDPLGLLKVEVRHYCGLPAYLRRFGQDPKLCVSKLRSVGAFSFALLPQPGVANRAGIYGNALGDWDDTTQGIFALRSAISHCRWEEIKLLLGDAGLLLQRLVDEDPKPKPKFKRILRVYTPNESNCSEIVISFRNKHCYMEDYYGEWVSGPTFNSKTWTFKEMVDLLYPLSE